MPLGFFYLTMNTSTLKKLLTDLPMGEIRYYKSVGSTNDIALSWAAQGAPDLSLVIADEQTSGRGRGQRIWYTQPGSGLAFSLVLKITQGEQPYISRYPGLGALSVSGVLNSMGLTAQIKWPNDILLNGKKICGILIESALMGDRVDCIVMGIGLNVFSKAIPPPEKLQFPATSLEDELVLSDNAFLNLDKYELLRQILNQILFWRKQLNTKKIISTWKKRLAFVGENIEIWGEERMLYAGELIDLDDNGSLRIKVSSGEMKVVNYGEIHLHPVL